MTAWFLIQSAGIACGDESAELSGETKGGVEFRGSDVIETINCDAGRVIRRPVEVHDPRTFGEGTYDYSRTN